jgi:hypothetical protein
MNGMPTGLDLAQAVVNLYPDYDHKPALMRAYKAADVDGNGTIGFREFRLLLAYTCYFNNLWAKFEGVRFAPLPLRRSTALVNLTPMPAAGAAPCRSA